MIIISIILVIILIGLLLLSAKLLLSISEFQYGEETEEQLLGYEEMYNNKTFEYHHGSFNGSNPEDDSGWDGE